jgi:hypothetical protein
MDQWGTNAYDYDQGYDYGYGYEEPAYEEPVYEEPRYERPSRPTYRDSRYEPRPVEEAVAEESEAESVEAEPVVAPWMTRLQQPLIQAPIVAAPVVVAPVVAAPVRQPARGSTIFSAPQREVEMFAGKPAWGPYEHQFVIQDPADELFTEMHSEPHTNWRTGIQATSWNTNDLDVKHGQVAHLPTRDYQLTEQTVHAMRSGIAPDASSYKSQDVRTYLNRLADETTDRIEIVERESPSTMMLSSYQRMVDNGRWGQDSYVSAIHQGDHIFAAPTDTPIFRQREYAVPTFTRQPIQRVEAPAASWEQPRQQLSW